MICFARTAALLVLFVSTASAAVAATETFRAQGNEPSWSIRKTADAIAFQPMEGEPVTVAPVPVPRKDGNAEIYEARIGGVAFALTIADTVCTDTMSGMPFPKSVTVARGEEIFTGCGGEPATLLHGDWIIAEVDGKPPVAGATPTLRFEAGGQVNGNASCNRFFGSYTLTGEGLSVSDIGSSMMMCDQPVMDQEMAVLEILKGLGGFAIGEDGALILRAHDGRTIAARPVA